VEKVRCGVVGVEDGFVCGLSWVGIEEMRGVDWSDK
jgi:hypothetical protein